MYGGKKRYGPYYRELEHFAMRAFKGPIRYDSEFMSLLSYETVYDAAVSYGMADGLYCANNLRVNNNQLLNSIAEEVHAELLLLGAPTTMFRKATLILSCVLGSDAWRSKMNDE